MTEEGARQCPVILYLYAEVMGYTLATMRALRLAGAAVHVVHWDKKKLTPFTIGEQEGLRFYSRSDHPESALRDLVAELEPDICVVSGWMDPDYLTIARVLRRRRIPVVVGLDGQWHGTLKQRVAAAWAAIGGFRRDFSHAWVAGPRQAVYAARLGFQDEDVIYDLYAADRQAFHPAEVGAPMAKTFLFVGRFAPEKGLGDLLAAWQGIERKGWVLRLIGNGQMSSAFASLAGCEVLDFLQPAELAVEMRHAGGFVLPSRYEPWGVVIHEAALSGVPIVTTTEVGSADAFVINGANGYLCRPHDPNDLRICLQKMIDLTESARGAMAQSSVELANRITAESSAMRLLGLL